MTPHPARKLGKAGSNNGRAADSIIHALEAQIISGKLENNAPLPTERELMEQFGASRTVIREAISALSNRQLLESKPRYRPVVRKPNYETALHAVGGIVSHLLTDTNGIRNLYQSRVFIERALVRDAAIAATKEDIYNLKTALAANKAAIESEDFYATDMAFHGVLYRIPNNPIFPAIHQGYNSWLGPHWQRMPPSHEHNLNNYQAHELIVNCILDRDPAAAEEALLCHLNDAWEYVRITFDLG